MKRLTFLFALVVLGLGGRGGSDEEPTVAAGQAPFDRAFIDAMVPHHQAAIEMATEAKDAGLAAPELVGLADNIISTQQAEIDQMLEWRETWFGSKAREPESDALEALGLSAAEAGMDPRARLGRTRRGKRRIITLKGER